MKKFIFSFLAGFLYLFAGCYAAQAISLRFAPSTQSVLVGDTIFVDLLIDDLVDAAAPSMSAFDVNVRFDPTILLLDTTDANGDGLIDSILLDPFGQLNLDLIGTIGATRVVGTDIVNLALLSQDIKENLDNFQSGSFPLATMTFQARAAGTSLLTAFINDVVDSNDDVLNVEVIESGAVTVGASTAVPEPSSLLLLSVGVVGLLWRYRR